MLAQHQRKARRLPAKWRLLTSTKWRQNDVTRPTAVFFAEAKRRLQTDGRYATDCFTFPANAIRDQSVSQF